MGKSLSKTQKKTDNNIRITLTRVCDSLLETLPGFLWLTHTVDYSNFPASLIITCVFDTNEDIERAEKNGDAASLRKTIQAKLLKIGIKFNFLEKQIRLDSEEDCNSQHEGNWAARIDERSLFSASLYRPPTRR